MEINYLKQCLAHDKNTVSVSNNFLCVRDPYNADTLQDRKLIKANMLTNPFEKFERKRFLYHSKDLGVISMNHALFSRMEEMDFQRVREQMLEDIKNYYRQMGV